MNGVIPIPSLAVPLHHFLRHSYVEIGGDECVRQQIIDFIDTRWH
jgi:hypothetical protein